jgi:endo-1,4-beta-xylanase
MRQILDVYVGPALVAAAFAMACGSSSPAELPLEPVPEFAGNAGTESSPVDPGPPDGEMPGAGGSGSETLNPDTPLAPPVVEPPPTTPPPVEPPPPAPSLLREAAAQSGRLIGVALQARLLDDASYTSAAKEFGSVTAENEMKWQSLEPQPNQFNFGPADRIVAFAEENAMAVRGHTLVWHSQLPGWVSQLTTPEAVREAMLNHIDTVVTRYRGRVFAWDVVNEAWQDGEAALRTSVFQAQLGDRFIDEAFFAARAADPDAKLYYNDYGTEGTGRKANSVFTMVQGMLERGVPIDGVGMQMHVTNNDGGPSAQQFATNMQRLVDLGLQVNISGGTVDERLAAQRQRAQSLVQACMDQPGCDFITVWGVADQYSWRRRCEDGSDALPLLFNNGYEKKPAYSGVFDALMGP